MCHHKREEVQFGATDAFVKGRKARERQASTPLPFADCVTALSLDPRIFHRIFFKACKELGAKKLVTPTAARRWSTFILSAISAIWADPCSTMQSPESRTSIGTPALLDGLMGSIGPRRYVLPMCYVPTMEIVFTNDRSDHTGRRWI